MADDQQQPPAWVTGEEPFDPARAWQTIQNLERRCEDLDKQRGDLESRLSEHTAAEERVAELERGIREKAEEEIRLRIAIDAQERGLPDDVAKDVHHFIDVGLWATDSNAAFRDLYERKPYLFTPPPVAQRNFHPGA